MFNPIEASDSIKKSYIDYITTTLHITHPHYSKLFRDALNVDGAVAKGPYLDVSGSFKNGRSLHELVNDGLISNLFLNMEAVPEKEKEIKIMRPLYTHQEEALLLADKGNNNERIVIQQTIKWSCSAWEIIFLLCAKRRI